MRNHIHNRVSVFNNTAQLDVYKRQIQVRSQVKRFFFLPEKEMVQTPYYVIINFFIWGHIQMCIRDRYFRVMLPSDSVPICSDVSSGEQISIALLAMAIEKIGCPVVSLSLIHI